MRMTDPALSLLFALCLVSAGADGVFARDLPGWPCDPASFQQTIDRILRDQASDSSVALFEVRYADADATSPAEAKEKELMTLSSETVDGGSQEIYSVRIYRGTKDGLCQMPGGFDVPVDTSQPVHWQTIPSGTAGAPRIRISYRFHASNRFGDYATTSSFVSDDRIEEYALVNGYYRRVFKKVISCIECAEPRESGTTP